MFTPSREAPATPSPLVSAMNIHSKNLVLGI